MKRITFIYLCIFFILFITLPLSNGEDNFLSNVICALAIGVFGLPHGAIDHLLFKRKSPKSMTYFYTFYLALMVLYVILWYLFPVLSLLIFLLISAYHFGESQLTLLRSKPVINFTLYLLWGVHVLGTFLTYQLDAILPYFNGGETMDAFATVFSFLAANGILVFTSLFLLGAIASYSIMKGDISIQELLEEIYVLGLIHLSFYLFGPLISFTLYFVILHSIKVLHDEFSFLRQGFVNLSVSSFFKLLFPFSALSIIGLLMIFFLNYYVLELPFIFLVLAMTSVITLPHAFVMYLFYKE